LFELSYFSEGAINIAIAYELPVHLRNFYYKQLSEIKAKESKSLESSQKSNKKFDR
jgi:hypothetical protein